MKLAAVAFDIDGTLYANSAMYLRSAGFALRHWRLLRAVNNARAQLRHSGVCVEDFFSAQADLVARELRMEPARAREALDSIIYRQWAESLRGIRLFPQVRETFALCRDLGLRLGLASDFPVEGKLEILGIRETFDATISTEATGCLKPAALPFRMLADALGCPCERVLYVGNSYRYDVLGARSVGMQTAHLSRRRRPDSLADCTFHDYRDLQNWIRRFCQ